MFAVTYAAIYAKESYYNFYFQRDIKQLNAWFEDKENTPTQEEMSKLWRAIFNSPVFHSSKCEFI